MSHIVFGCVTNFEPISAQTTLDSVFIELLLVFQADLPMEHQIITKSFDMFHKEVVVTQLCI